MRAKLPVACVIVLGVLGGAGTGGSLPGEGFVTLSLDVGGVLKAAQSGHVVLGLPTGAIVLDLEPNPIAEGALIGVDGVHDLRLPWSEATLE